MIRVAKKDLKKCNVYILTMTRTEALKEAQRRYREKNYKKCLEINAKSKKNNYKKNRNYANRDDMGKSFRLLFG